MDLLRSWLYGREKPERFTSKPASTNEISINVSHGANGNRTITGKIHHIENDSENKSDSDDQELSNLENLILKVVPLEPGDCLGCKLVGTSVMAASGIIVLTSAIAGIKRNPSLTGRKLTTYYAVCGSLFIGFEGAAVCRFFDLGPFSYLSKLHTKDHR